MKMEILADPERLARRAAEWLMGMVRGEPSRVAIALSGGSTPRGLYRLLVEEESFPWSRVHWFWGDERFVPAHDPASNYRMAAEAMLSQAPIPPANIHPILTEGVGPEEAASRYERALQSFYGAERLDPARPLFDVALLGLGLDGHTASLFPGSVTLEERRRWVVPIFDANPKRITLTFPALESARTVVFLVAGKEKRAILRRWREGDRSLPAARLHPWGSLLLFADRAAAS